MFHRALNSTNTNKVYIFHFWRGKKKISELVFSKHIRDFCGSRLPGFLVRGCAFFKKSYFKSFLF